MNLLFFLILSAQAEKTHVIIDPGHGGQDQGAVQGRLREADLSFTLARSLKVRLDQDPRFKTTLTRGPKEGPSLEDRTRLARAAKGDLFISLHLNISLDEKVRGAEFYFQNPLPPDEESMYLASHEVSENPSQHQELDWPLQPPPGAQQLSPEVATIIKDLQRSHRIRLSADLASSLHKKWGSGKKIRQGPFYVVSQVNMPSTLVEVGFLSNPSERKRLQAPEHQAHIIENLYHGVVDFCLKHLSCQAQ